jgi:hypothetical protein
MASHSNSNRKFISKVKSGKKEIIKT